MWLALLSLAGSAAELSPGKVAIVRFSSDCASCAGELAEALSGVKGVESVSVAADHACVTASAAISTDALATAAKGCDDLVLGSVDLAESCPSVAAPASAKDPWASAPAGADVKVVSRGEAFAVNDVLAAGKFTIVDFGASWCGPCHAAAKLFGMYAADHPDVAIRVVSLDAKDAKASFALPAAAEHLRDATGIPWFFVYDAKGKAVYRGGDPARALAVIDGRR